MASSVFIWPGLAPGGSFSGQMIGPAADNTAAPPFTFTGDTTTGYASSAVGTLDLVTAGTSRLKVNSKGVGIGATIPSATSTFGFLFVGNSTLAAQTGAGGEFDFGWNWYYNSGFKYRVTDTAAKFGYNNVVAGAISFQLAGSGSADAGITFVEELRISTTAVTAFQPIVSSGYLVGARSAAGQVQNAATQLTLSGATTTATNLIPAGAFVVGVATTTTTTITGASGYTVGDGSDVDRWGDITGTAVGTHSANADATANPTGWFSAANNIVLTAKTSNFTGGVVQVVVFYVTTASA